MSLELDHRPSKLANEGLEELARDLLPPVAKRDVAGVASLLANRLDDPIAKNLPFELFFARIPLDQEQRLGVVSQAMKSLNPWYELTPEFLNLKARNYIATNLTAIEHLSKSIIEESHVEQTAEITKDKILSLVSQQFALKEFLARMQSSMHKGLAKEEVIAKSWKANKPELDFIEQTIKQYLNSNGQDISFSIKSLYKIQPLLWEMLTANEVVVSPDYHYRAKISALPETTRSLFVPPSYPDYYHATSYGDYLSFVEAASSSELFGFTTSFGFLHFVEVDQDGIAYQVEYPHVMVPNEILDIQSPIIEEILNIDLQFYRNHDLWHNLLPVYSDGFILHHPYAPLSHGGRTKDYLQFGRNMRANKEEYELALGIAHKEIQIRRGKVNPEIRLKQFSLIFKSLDLIKDLHQQLLSSNDQEFGDRVVDYLSTIVVSRALNVFPSHFKEYQYIDQKLSELKLPDIQVTKNDLLYLFYTQKLVTIEEPLGDNPLKTINTFSRQQINQYLNGVESEPQGGESGAEHVLQALREIGLWPMSAEQVFLSGLAKTRWLTIMMPQRTQLKGYAEKVSAKSTILFGKEKPTSIHPFDLLVKQTEAIEKNLDDYQVRILAVQLNQRLARSLFRMIFPDDTSSSQPIYQHLRNAFAKGEVESAKKFVAIVDKMIASLATHTYQPIDESEIEFAVSFIDKSARVKPQTKIFTGYNQLCQAQQKEMTINGHSFVQAKSDLLEGVMGLSS